MGKCYCISINYKHADLLLREKVAFDQTTRGKMRAHLAESGKIAQCVILCTCNRTEVYYFGEKDATEEVLSALSANSGIEKQTLLEKALFYEEQTAMEHLFLVTAGLTSMVLGEDEILGQMRDAYAESENEGLLGYEFHILFQGAFACAKRIKTETEISKTSVSIATLAAKAAAEAGDDVQVLLIGGTGKIGQITLKNLLSYEHIRVIATARTHSSLLHSMEEKGRLLVVDYKDRYEELDHADVIISATSSPHFTLLAQKVASALVTEKKRLFLDLAVPQDIDDGVAALGGCTLMHMDDFAQLAKENDVRKRGGVVQAREMIAEDLDEVKKTLMFHEFLPKKDAVLANYQDKSVEQMLYILRDRLKSEEFSHVLTALEGE